MPDILNDDDLSPLAAEYVLGTLDANERTRANVLLDVDHQFLTMVRIWERRLGELHLMVEPVEPEPRIWQRIRGKLKNVAPLAAAAVPVAPPIAPAAKIPAPPAPAAVPVSASAPAPKMPTSAPIAATGMGAPPAPPLRMPTAAPFEVAPVSGTATAPAPRIPSLATASTALHEPSAPPSSAMGHKLAGLIQEVEKISADAKLAEKTDAAVKPVELAFELAFAAPTEPESKVEDSEPVGSKDPAIIDAAATTKSDELADHRAVAEMAPHGAAPVVPEPRPTVAELAAKLAPEPADVDRSEPRPVDRIRREPSSAQDSTRKRAGRASGMDAARPPNVGLWRSVAAVMLLVSIALGSLIASWRYIPERLPAGLRPTAVLNLSEVTSSIARRPASTEAQFDE